MCGKRLTFLKNSPYEQVEYNLMITFEVARLSTCMFKKCPEKNIFTIIFVIIELEGF